MKEQIDNIDISAESALAFMFLVRSLPAHQQLSPACFKFFAQFSVIISHLLQSPSSPSPTCISGSKS